jgi:hypothetical protein
MKLLKSLSQEERLALAIALLGGTMLAVFVLALLALVS